MAAALGPLGLPVVVMNPRQVWNFVKATGKLAKTDGIVAHRSGPYESRTRDEPG